MHNYRLVLGGEASGRICEGARSISMITFRYNCKARQVYHVHVDEWFFVWRTSAIRFGGASRRLLVQSIWIVSVRFAYIC